MRVALTHAYSWPEVRRGAERIIRELSLALAARGHDVTVLTSGSPSGTTRADGVTTVRMGGVFRSEARHEREFALRLAPQLLRRRFDVVHSLLPRDAVTAVRTARVRGHRTVYMNLGIPFRWYWERRPEGAAHDRVVRDVDVYGCMSRFALGVLADEYGRDGVLMPGGVDMKEFVPATVREPAPTILFSGAVYEPRKGVANLLEAAAILAESERDLRVWLSGPGDARQYLDAAPAAARACTEVLPLGGPHDQAERYGRAWVTALPSVGDSFGMVLIESLACGTPIVVSDNAALPELVQPGVTGELCEPGDPASIAAALRTGLDLARRRHTAEACRSAASAYDWHTSIAPLFESYYEG